MRRIILSLLLCLCLMPAAAQQLIVISVSGKPEVIKDKVRSRLKPYDVLTLESMVNVPYNSSFDVIDKDGGKQYHIKTPGRNTLAQFMANRKNGISNTTRKYIDYITELVNGGAKRAARAHSDAATITRRKAVVAENESEEDEWDVEAWKRDFDEFTKEIRDEYEKFREECIREYQEFRAEINSQFADMMADDDWENVKRNDAVAKPEDKQVKPLVIPRDDKNAVPPIESKALNIEGEVMLPGLADMQPLPIVPIVQDARATVVDTMVLPNAPIMPEPKLANEMTNTKMLDSVKVEKLKLDAVEVEEIKDPVGHEIKIYGTKVYVRYEPTTPFQIASLREADLAAAWRTLSSEDFNNTIADCLAIRYQLKLSDWGYLMLLDQVGKTLMGESNEATMLTAYIYCQSGYKMRLAKSLTKIYLLYASRHNIYGRDYFILNEENFYTLNCEESELFICKLSFPEEQSLSLVLSQEQVLADVETPVRTLQVAGKPDMQLDVSVNRNLIDFYDNYPASEIGGNMMTRWAMYANTPLAANVRESIYPTLKEKIKDKGQYDKVNWLLDFVQHSLEYKYDEEVWGADRAFFAEETLYYPYADCEDRSILFSRLVRDLVGLDVVLVFYPGHLATAVHFTDEVKGDYIDLEAGRFVVCDPTYIGASVGRSMPGLENDAIQVILLNKSDENKD